MADALDSATGRAPGHVGATTAFLVVAALLVLGAFVARAGRGPASEVSSPPAARPAAPAEPGSPAEDEILDRFSALRRLFVRSYRERDASLVRLFAAPDAPRLGDTSEIRWLLRNHVLDRTRWRSRARTVVARAPNHVVVRERLVLVPRFVEEGTGRDAAPGEGPQLQTIEWTLRRYDEGWRLYDAVALSSRPAPRSGP